jgi:hypothetical protein
MRSTTVVVTYEPQVPQHYTARLGRGGWCEGWGWSAPQALYDLARVVEDLRPTDQVPADVIGDRVRLVRWLQDRAGTPVLAE